MKIKEIFQNLKIKRKPINLGNFYIGLIFLTTGFILLLNSLNILQINMQFGFVQFWPILFIFLGLRLIKFKKLIWQFFALFVVFIISLLSIFIIFNETGLMRMKLNTYPIRILREDGILNVNLHLKTGFSDLKIDSSTNNFLVGDFVTNQAQLLVSSNTNELRQKDITLGFDAPTNIYLIGLFSNIWDLNLNSYVPYDLNIESSISNLDLDLEKVNIRNLNIDASICDINLNFGKVSGTTTVDIDSSVSRIVIKLPKDVGASVSLSGGLILKELTDFTMRGTNYFETANYNHTNNIIDFRLNSNLTGIEIIRK